MFIRTLRSYSTERANFSHFRDFGGERKRFLTDDDKSTGSEKCYW